MKKLTKIKVKYFLIITCLLILFGIALPTFMKYYTAVTANAVGYAKETRTSTYKKNSTTMVEMAQWKK